MADNVYNLKFTLSNGDVIDAGQITAPQGPKGDKGDSGTIDVNTLIALLSSSNGITIVNDIANDKAQINVDPRYITFSQSIEINPNGTATEIYITDNPTVGFYEFTNDHAGEICYNYNGSNETTVLQAGPKGNVKTLFGNQSIYGSGNIDLYKHTLEIKVGGNSIFTTFYSSNNLSIDSLTGWKTVVGNEFSFPAWGMYNGQVVRDVTQGGFDSLTSTFANDFVLWTSISFTIIDTVTTV